jgi:potassium/hydrogen antiporter
MTGEILASFVMAAVLGVVGGVIWLLLLNAVRQFPNSAFTTLAWAFILYGITESMHFSGAIAVVAFGATLTNHERMNLKALKPLRNSHFGEISESDRVFYGEILFLLKTFFFVYLGLSLRLSNLRLFALAGLFIAVIYLLRPLIVKVTVPRGDGGWESDALMSVMIPKGLVSAVLAAIPVAANIEGARTLRDFTYFAVPLSILVTALLVLLLQKPPLVSLYRRLYAGKPAEIRAN